MDSASLTRCLTHIQAHLDGDLTLEKLAEIAGCSPPYFSRRFAAVTGETPKQYTSRLRVERAALRLILLDDRIIEVATDCGFANHETFCRAFSRQFGVSPHTFRLRGRLRGATDRQVPHRTHAAPHACLSSTSVRTLQPMILATIRHTGPYEDVPIGSWDRLVAWAVRRGIPGPYVFLGIAHDAPGLTKDEHLRFDAALRVPAEFRSGRSIGCQRFAGGLFALTTNVGPFTSLPAAYTEAFRRVMNNRSLECLGVPCVEFYRVNRVSAEVSIVSTEIAIPVRRQR